MDLKSEHRTNRVEIPDEMNEHKVSQLLSYGWDGGDPWGSAMAEAFALADFVTFVLGERVPDEFHYEPAMGGPVEEDHLYQELLASWLAGYFDRDDAFDYLMVLDRFLDACKAASLDY